MIGGHGLVDCKNDRERYVEFRKFHPLVIINTAAHYSRAGLAIRSVGFKLGFTADVGFVPSA